MAAKVQLRMDTAATWASKNPVLAFGEVGIVSETSLMKIGDGVKTWNTLTGVAVLPTATVYADPPTEPSMSDPTTLTIYNANVANRRLLKMTDDLGNKTTLQPFFARNKIGVAAAVGNVSTINTTGGYYQLTASGTATARTCATTNLFTRSRRSGVVSAATAGSICGQRVAAAQLTVGGAPGSGFFKTTRFGISDATVVATARMFVGVWSNTGAPTNIEPSTMTNCIGVGHGAADTNLQIFSGGTSAQPPIDLGSNFPCNTTTTDLYELSLYAPASTDDVYWEVRRLNTGHIARGKLTNNGGTSLPGTTTMLSYMQAWRTNNATAAAVGLDIISDYVETDY